MITVSPRLLGPSERLASLARASLDAASADKRAARGDASEEFWSDPSLAEARAAYWAAEERRAAASDALWWAWDRFQ